MTTAENGERFAAAPSSIHPPTPQRIPPSRAPNPELTFDMSTHCGPSVFKQLSPILRFFAFFYADATINRNVCATATILPETYRLIVVYNVRFLLLSYPKYARRLTHLKCFSAVYY